MDELFFSLHKQSGFANLQYGHTTFQPLLPVNSRTRMNTQMIIRSLLLITTLGTAHAFAQQAYPVRPVRLIVLFAPGGVTDVMAN